MALTKRRDRTITIFTCVSITLYYLWAYASVQNERAQLEAMKTCSPLDHVVFLKTHRTASTTVQNIFFRRGFYNNLTFVLPDSANYLGHPMYFTPELHIGANFTLPDLPHMHYDLLVLHSRLHVDNMRRVMPPDVKFVTLLRRPVDMFPSLFWFYDFHLKLKMSLQEFLSLPLEQMKQLTSTADRISGKIGSNQMSFDLGLNSSHFYDVDKVMEHIEMLDQRFSLVLITEHLEESLVLLVQELCWKLEDVTFLKANSRVSTATKPALSSEQEHKITELNSADELLYQHFLKRFQELVDIYGKDRMARDVARLKQLQQQVYDECVEKEMLHLSDASDVFSYMTYELKRNAPRHCHFYTLRELQFIDLLRTNQLNRFQAWKTIP